MTNPLWRRVAIATTLTVCMWSAAAVADERRFTAQVFSDRGRPERSIAVTDLGVNGTLARPEGVQHVVLRSDAGRFTVPFATIAEVEFLRFLGADHDGARYQARLRLRDQTTRAGVLELRTLLGVASGHPWRLLLPTRFDRGAGLHRIVLID